MNRNQFFFRQRLIRSSVSAMSEMDLKSSVALLTGGATGLGFAYGEELLRNGVKNLALLDLPTSCGEESVKKLNVEFGEGRVIFVACDVTKANEFEAGFARTVEKFGRLDIVINNAGIFNGPQWELMINVNFTSVVRGTLLGLQYMGKDKGGQGGVIVNVASLFGLDPVAYFPIYDGTKHAVVGFSRSLGLPYHYTRTGVRILTMCPGITDTPMVASAVENLLDFVDPKEAASALASYPFQKVENVAQAMVEIIRSAKSGTVWLSEGGDPVREVSIPDRFTMTASAKE